ncbi:manganese-dependent inorganic pyrophosphatase [Aliagarivorans marinus]|uniref:manganese-dependent inorganic pyrophosphatase n=1 Tax=Aliagarivorans marinus TaxID=561965 RepID=UPI0003F53E29|nr:manganese-dependent inorganic pyrophosphatase [Aliagarivorans marinus]
MKKSLIAIAALSAGMHAHAFDLMQPSLNDTSNLVWSGHISPDTDTVVSALLAAHIYGGTATVPGELNPESKFVLEQCGAVAPVYLDNYQGKRLGLVDFNQQTQLAPGMDEANIVAIIDHHAIGGNPVNTSQIVTLDIRPWGSAATMLMDRAKQLNIELPQELACAAIGAVLSDTVVFQSPTTTDFDRQLVDAYSAQAGLSNINEFGEQMLIAKSDLSHIDAATILTMDYKNFEFGGKKVGIGVAETLNAQQLIDRKPELLLAMQSYKQEQGLDHLFFSITDTKHKRANLLWVDPSDQQVVERAFQSVQGQDMLSLDGVTSRKRQIGPAIQTALEQ